MAHNSGNGIINVALEMKMTGECDIDCPNIVQYVIFPPHNKASVFVFVLVLVVRAAVFRFRFFN